MTLTELVHRRRRRRAASLRARGSLAWALHPATSPLEVAAALRELPGRDLARLLAQPVPEHATPGYAASVRAVHELVAAEVQRRRPLSPVGSRAAPT
ncbi:hypothetical protein [Nocardioides kribbensis]|uniref:Uncharacterized protein n=1 Tax=Nocardioides kribbensis TaxID=305517 RepID=A0ABV1NT18_9ACTN